MGEEVLIPFRPSREAATMLTAVRSTLISASFMSLREHGREERYLKELEPRYHEEVMFTPAGVWIPIATAEAHYAACDKLGLSAPEILAMGNRVAQATQKSALASILRLAKAAGTTPWALYTSCDTYWARMFQGSALATFRIGPKEARFEVAGCSLCRSPYWRTGLRGLLVAVSEPFAHKVYVRELSQLTTPVSCGFRISWA